MKLTPFEAGIFLLPVSIALSIFGPLSGWLSDRHGSKAISSLGLLISSIGFFMLINLSMKSTFMETLLPLSLIGSGMGIFASPNRASIMNAVPKYQRGIAAGTSTMFVLSGNTLSIGLAFLIMSNTMPIKYIESIFLGTMNTSFDLKIKNNISNNNNNDNNKSSKIIYENNNKDIKNNFTTLESTPIINDFLRSLHYIFLLSGILMLISIIPAYIKTGNNKKLNNSKKSN